MSEHVFTCGLQCGRNCLANVLYATEPYELLPKQAVFAMKHASFPDVWVPQSVTHCLPLYHPNQQKQTSSYMI